MRPRIAAGAAVGATALLLLIGRAAGGAAVMPVPAKMQMAIFKKVFLYDRTLAGKPVQVLVVHNGMRPDELQELLASFRWAEISAVPVHAHDLPEKIGEGSVAYIAPGVVPAAFMGPCAAHEVLSISGLPALAQQGSVSIAIGAGGDGKPEILVHRGRLKAEKHDISAELLKLARILQ